MTSPAHSTRRGRPRLLVLGAALGASLAACGGDERCDPDAPNTICTIAGSGEDEPFGEAKPIGDGGPATAARLYAPIDLAISPDGELWVIDFNHYVVRAIDKQGTIRTVIGSGLLGDSPPMGVPSVPALEAELNHTSDLLFHGGYLYLAAWHNSRVKRVRLSDMTLENFAGVGRRTYYDGDGGPALMASLDLPSSLAMDAAGNLALLDQANHVVRRVDADGTIRRIAGKCVADVEPTCAPNEQPVSCAGVPAYAGSNKLACGNLAVECAKPCGPAFAGDGGPALEARMAQPYGAQANPAGHLRYDAAGNLLFVDTDNHRIRKVDAAGVITTIAGSGGSGWQAGAYAGDGGPATEARLNQPGDLELGPDGTIYFSDVQNSCVRKIDPGGIISTVAGKCAPVQERERGAPTFGGDGGPPLEAVLDRPFGIHLDGKKLYVADTYNHRVRVVNLP